MKISIVTFPGSAAVWPDASGGHKRNQFYPPPFFPTAMSVASLSIPYVVYHVVRHTSCGITVVSSQDGRHSYVIFSNADDGAWNPDLVV